MNDPLTHTVWMIHLASTLYMVGLIWFVQIVHYPLLAKVGRAEFLAYEKEHVKHTTWVVSPMLVESSTSALLLWIRPAGVPDWIVWGGLSLSLAILFSTALIQVPCHRQLEQGFDAAVHRKLVHTNWIRTICWSLRGVIVIWIAWVTTSSILVSAQWLDHPYFAADVIAWSHLQ